MVLAVIDAPAAIPVFVPHVFAFLPFIVANVGVVFVTAITVAIVMMILGETCSASENCSQYRQGKCFF
jgi:hypothetical protein